MKFKNIKKKVYQKKSPSNSRTINEPFKFTFPKINSVKLLATYSWALKVFVGIIFVATVIIVGYDLQNNLKARQNVDLERGVLAKDLYFWENFISKHQDYRDAYFQASILEYKLGNMPKAKMYAEKGLSLDPNSQDGRKIEDFLSK